MGRKLGDRTESMKRSLAKLLPDVYTIYKQKPTEYDELGLPIKSRTAILYNGTNLIPCRLQEYRVARDQRTTLGPDLTQNLHEIVTLHDAPLYVNYIITINNIDYEVTKVNYPANLSPYQSAIIVNLGEVQNATG